MMIKTTESDVSRYLDSPEMIVEYLNLVLETGDVEALLIALQTVKRARGDQSNRKALDAEGEPHFATISNALHAFGLKMTVAVRADPLLQS